MLKPRVQETERLLEALVTAEVEFVVVGGVAANAHGSSMTTKDLDVVLRMTTENMGRLKQALRDCDPRHVARPELCLLDETEERLATYNYLLIDTTLGRLDVLRHVEPVGDIDKLTSVPVKLFKHHSIAVLDLKQLIVVKAHTARPKDRLLEVELRAILELIEDAEE